MRLASGPHRLAVCALLFARAPAGPESGAALEGPGSAAEAVAASESARTLRDSRYRQGLLPLTDVLDADSALAGARALLVRSRFEARLVRAALQLATGAHLEGVGLEGVKP